MPRQAVPSYVYVLVVVAHAGRFLLVHERKHGQTWYLPAGGVEPGETVVNAAIRETWEEAGIAVQPEGLLWVEHEWLGVGGSLASRWRFILTARPVGATTPKHIADQHTLEARWATTDELEEYPFRDYAVVPMLKHVQAGALVTPLRFYRAIERKRAPGED